MVCLFAAASAVAEREREIASEAAVVLVKIAARIFFL